MRIALALSGGGYRAAAYHLGVLELLHHIGLLGNVGALSTVSGGTLVGARYARALLRGESFEAFRDGLAAFLLETNVVARAVERLSTERRAGWGGRQRGIITAAADVYADGAMLGETRLGELFGARTHVDEWSFNATEFDGGIAFRFQASRDPEARIGNGNVWLSREEAAGLRLADIAAASSCFPGAFEPMVMPRDFVWPGGVVPAVGPVALMDGGIYDNQGIDALLLAELRAPAGKGFDLFVISDSHRKTPRMMAPEDVAASGPKLKHLVHAGEVLAAAAGIGAALMAVETVRTWEAVGSTEAAVRAAAALTLLGVTASSVAFWQRVQREVRAQLPELSDAFWRMLGELRLGEAIGGANVRLRSLLAMTTDVFMKRVRGLSYDRLFHEVGHSRVVNNLIHDLETEARRARAGLNPTEAQLEVMRAACAVPTTLWFTRGAEELEALRACGHNTLCFNLLEHLRLHHQDRETRVYEEEVRPLAGTLEALWARLQADPRALLKGERATSVERRAAGA